MTTAKRHILIADDDPIILELLEKALIDAEYQVFAACSGEQAIEISTTNSIDLVLLDYRMPGLSGLDTGKAIRNLTSVRFILMSAFADKDIIMQAADDGMLQFIAKPLNLSDVITTIGVQLIRADEIKEYEKSFKDLEKNSQQGITRAIESARSVNTAIGLIMERYKISRDQASNMLLARTRNERRRAVDLSEQIIKTREAEYVWESETKLPSSDSKKSQ